LPEFGLPKVFSDNLEDWMPFPDNMESLGISRTSMPQVQGQHRGALIKFLNARGFDHEKKYVDPQSLHPSQAVFSPTKVSRATSFPGPQRALIVSNDNYVADGHHQWLANYTNDEIPVIQIDCPIAELLLELSRFPSSGVSDVNGNSKY